MSSVQDFLNALQIKSSKAATLAKTLPEAAVNAELPSGQTLLGTACMHKNVNAIVQLIARGARTDTRDKFNCYPCDWLLGVVEPEENLKARFAAAHHCQSDAVNVHDDAVFCEALHALIKSRVCTEPSTPRCSLFKFVHPNKRYYQLLRQFQCTCDNQQQCICTLKKPTQKVIDYHLASETSNNVDLLAEVFNQAYLK